MLYYYFIQQKFSSLIFFATSARPVIGFEVRTIQEKSQRYMQRDNRYNSWPDVALHRIHFQQNIENEDFRNEKRNDWRRNYQNTMC